MKINIKLKSKKLYSVMALITIVSINNAYAARCDNFHSVPGTDNRQQCDLLKAGTSANFACKMEPRGGCHSTCPSLDAFEEDCIANQACEWHPYVVYNPCQERHGGWVPQF